MCARRFGAPRARAPEDVSDKGDIRSEANRLQNIFEALGADVFETDILQPAGALLDLYGEDIRARAFVTHDPNRGEMMLRPDFTLSLVQHHIAEGRRQGRYTYAGEVFRRQEDDPARKSEYLQVGYEVFNGEDPHVADAEVFFAISEILVPLGLRAATGDIGLLRAAVAGLDTSDARKSSLIHHLWRPKRFRHLLGQFCQGPIPNAAAQSFQGARDWLANPRRHRGSVGGSDRRRPCSTTRTRPGGDG